MLGDRGPARELLGAIARDRLSSIETVQLRAVELALTGAGDAAWDDFLTAARTTAPRYLHDLIEHRATAACRHGLHDRARELLDEAEAAAQKNDPVAHARIRAALTALVGRT
jgi:hypothetical protein